MNISQRRLPEQFLVRMNTASEKVLRRRSARGATLLYDLRFRRNTVHCSAKFGSLLDAHVLKPPLSGVRSMISGTYKWTLRRVKWRHSLGLVSYKGRRRAVGRNVVRVRG